MTEDCGKDRVIAALEKEKEEQCDPCLRKNTQAKAKQFCEICKDSEFLCEDCSQKHTLLDENNEISEDLDIYKSSEETTIEKNHFLWLSYILRFFSWLFSWLISFRRQDTFRKSIVEDETRREHSRPQMQISCQPCFRETITAEATKFCKTCKDPEPLCEDCAHYHTLLEANEGHEMTDDLQQFLHANSEEKPQHQMQVSCKHCFHESVTSKATKCCKTCKDPEPLCDVCAQRHTLQEANKEHEMTDDLQQFLYPKTEAKPQPQMQISCKQCFRESIITEASKCCKTCKDPEPLCEDCAQHHTLEEANIEHEMTDNLHQCLNLISGEKPQTQMQLSCKQCLHESITTKATQCCQTCKDPEPLCDDCAQRHTFVEANIEHEMTDDLQQFFIPKSEKNAQALIQISCRSCFRETIKAEATKCCKTCKDPEPLCDFCAHRHTLKEANKGHEMTDDLQQFFDHNSVCGNTETKDDKVPGKPYMEEATSNYVKICWDKPREKFDCFQIRYKKKDGESKWKYVETDDDSNSKIIKEVMADTAYVFQVRGKFDDLEGPYSPISDDITTPESPSAGILKNCSCVRQTTPKIYRIPLEENKKARNSTARTKQLYLGTACQNYIERTIMLVGATGSGKSTMVDGIVNYILGVNFEDPFRFTMVVLEEEEKKTTDQALSQTEWITVYKIYPTKGSLLNFTLNIIDTPGFGDTRGIERDNGIVEQIRHLFTDKGDQGVTDIDAVCFIAKAPDARLTPTQKYIFGSIMSLFGKDIESNICTLITFADGAEPAVLASLKNSNLPFGNTFTFNNSALFAENQKGIGNQLSPTFWNMGCSSFENFFQYIWDLETQSLLLTRNVLDERNRLKTIIANILPQVNEGLLKISDLKREQEVVKKHKNAIRDNKNFQYTVEEIRQIKVDLKPGIHVTNCLTCNISCHNPCAIPDDEQKRVCAAMDRTTGKCEVCPQHCDWTFHKNNRYYLSHVTIKVTKTYDDMKKRFEQATKETFTIEQFIQSTKNAVQDKLEKLSAMMDKVNECRSKLQQIALTDDPLTSEEYIDLLIESEKREHKRGYPDRIKTLEELKKMSRVDKEYAKLNEAKNEAMNRLLEDESCIS